MNDDRHIYFTLNVSTNKSTHAVSVIGVDIEVLDGDKMVGTTGLTPTGMSYPWSNPQSVELLQKAHQYMGEALDGIIKKLNDDNKGDTK